MDVRDAAGSVLRRVGNKLARLVEEPKAPSKTGAAQGGNGEPDWLREPSFPLDCTEAEAERWDAEWLRYLGREWRTQLEPFTSYPARPELPRNR